LYGATGTTTLSKMQDALIDGHMLRDPLSIAALAMIVVGLGFKASAVPLHMWTPDVYDGAPTPITAFMATGTKVAAFAGFIRIFSDSLIGMFDDWRLPVALLAAVTIIVGNIAALLQPGMKRMLAYSGIAQAGYVLIGIASGSMAGIEAVLYYLVAYTAMTMAAFAVVVMREREVLDGDQVNALRGLGRSRPMMGVVLTIAMLSLAGFPPLAGFIGKFMLFGAAVDADMTWLAVVGAVGSMISLGYYLKVVAVTWQTGPPADDTTYRTPRSVTIVAVVSAAAVVLVALFGESLLTLCNDAAQGLIGTINR
jgi:NADH-quinone oxidoreductase subunit N